MPPMDVALTDRHRMLEHMGRQLQQLGQATDKAGIMARKVEGAAYDKATNKQEYLQYLQTSMKKAQVALQRQSQQAQGAQQAQVQQQQAQQQALQQAALQQAAHQQQQVAQLNAQAQAQQHARQQQQQVAQQPQAVHMSVQQQFMQQTPTQQQQQYVQQAPVQQQYLQQAAVQPQYVQQAPQQHLQQQPVAQPQYLQQATQQQHQYMQQPAAVQQYVRPAAVPVAQPQQQQYVQQYVAQPAPQQQQYVQHGMQQAPQQQYMQQPAPQQQQHMQQQAAQQYAQQQAVAQSQYVQQQQPAQQQFGQVQMPMQQVPGQQYMQQQGAAQAQFVQQAGGGGYTVQQFGAAAPAPVPGQQQQLQALPPMQQPAAAGGAAAIQPRQLDAADFARLPSLNDPAFAEFAADFLPDNGQAAVGVKAQPQQQQVGPQQQQRYMPPQPQLAAGDSLAAVSALHAASPSVGGTNSGSQARDAAAAAQRKAHVHDPAALQEFLRLHAAFNNPLNRAITVRDSERMLNCYRDHVKTMPVHAERLASKVQHYEVILRLLVTDQPHHQISGHVLKLAKAFVRDLTIFKDMMKKSSLRAAALGVGGASGATANSAPGNAPSPAGFLAMLETGESDAAMKMPAPFLGATGTMGGVKLEPAQAQAAGAGAGAAGPPSAAAEAARQQALVRQRQLAEAAAEAQRRREAAAAAAAALPAGGPPRLLAVAAQLRGQQEAAAVQAGFQRLQKVLRAAEQRQLAPSQGAYQVQAVSTPPLPAEVQRLVAQERAALEEAAAGAPGGSRSGVTGVLTVAGEEGHVPEEGQQQGDGSGSGPPPAKRQRSASPEFGAGAGQQQPAGVQQQQAQQQAQQRQKSDLELRVAAECEEAVEALGGALLLHVAPDTTDPRCALVTCLPNAAAAAAAAGAAAGAGAAGAAVPGSASGQSAKEQWQLLRLRVPPGYPQEAPTAVFCRNGQGGASEAQAAAAARSQQLWEACRERFAAALAAAGGTEPLKLQRIVQAWMGAVQQVEALAGGAYDGEG